MKHVRLERVMVEERLGFTDMLAEGHGDSITGCGDKRLKDANGVPGRVRGCREGNKGC